MIGEVICIFNIKGAPKAQKRHRTHNNMQYDPSAADKKAFARQVISVKECDVLEIPIALKVWFFMPIAKSRRKKVQPGDLHTQRCDVDNLCKFLFDALNGIVWKDDSQICGVEMYKVFSEEPSTYFEVIDARTVRVQV